MIYFTATIYKLHLQRDGKNIANVFFSKNEKIHLIVYQSIRQIVPQVDFI